MLPRTTLHFPTDDPPEGASRWPMMAGHRIPPAVVCSYCDETIREGSEPVSHGYCDDCMAKHWPEVEA